MASSPLMIDSLGLSLLILTGIRLTSALVFLDLTVNKRQARYALLLIGWLTLTLGTAWGLYTHLAWEVMEHHFFSLAAGLGSFWVGCGILAYFKAIDQGLAFFGRRFVIIGSAAIFIYGLLPLVGLRLGPSPGVFAQVFMALLVTGMALYKRRSLRKLSVSSYYWLVGLAVLSVALSLAIGLRLIGPGQMALGFAGAAFIQVVTIIFLLQLEFNLSHRDLARSEQRFSRLAENARDLIYRYEFEPQRGFTYVSPAATSITGYTPEEHYADPDLGFKIIHPDDRHLLESVVAGDPEEPQPLTLRWVKKDSTVIWCEQRNVPIYDASGRLVALEGIARDISPERRAAQQYRLLFQEMQEGFALHEILLDDAGNPVDYRFLSVNPAFEHLTGLKAGDIIGRTALEVLPDLEPCWVSTYGRVALTGEPVQFIDYSGPLGRYYEVHAFSPAPNQFAAIFSDVTERLRAEEQLQHSHDLMRYVIEHNRSCVAVHDRDLNYIYVSQRYLDDYQVADQDVIGKHHYDVFPDLPHKWREVHQQALAGQVSSAEDDPYEREDGSVDWTRWECRPWYEADGSIGGIIVYTEIINERRRIEGELRGLTEKLESQVAEKTRELQDRVAELERFQEATIERELRMKELREEIKKLKAEKVSGEL